MSKKPINLKMFFPDFMASMRIGNFITMKHTIFSQIIGKPENTHLIYSFQEFTTLLKSILSSNSNDVSGLRIYFASYSHDPNPDLIPPGKEDTLTLIYAPTKKDSNDGRIHQDTGDYFIKDAKNQIINLKNSKNIASQWVRNYQEKKLPILNSIFFGNPYESKCIWYDRECIKELHDFLVNVDGDSEDIPAYIALFFATYHLNHREPGGTIKHFENKLTLIFSFMCTYTTSGVEYYYYLNKLENDADPQPPAKDGVFDGSGDTGVPCPPPPTGSTCPGALP